MQTHADELSGRNCMPAWVQKHGPGYSQHCFKILYRKLTCHGKKFSQLKLHQPFADIISSRHKDKASISIDYAFAKGFVDFCSVSVVNFLSNSRPKHGKNASAKRGQWWTTACCKDTTKMSPNGFAIWKGTWHL